MNEEDCKFDKIHLVYQNIEKHQIQSMLETIYNTIYFLEKILVFLLDFFSNLFL